MKAVDESVDLYCNQSPASSPEPDDEGKIEKVFLGPSSLTQVMPVQVMPVQVMPKGFTDTTKVVPFDKQDDSPGTLNIADLSPDLNGDGNRSP